MLYLSADSSPQNKEEKMDKCKGCELFFSCSIDTVFYTTIALFSIVAIVVAIGVCSGVIVITP
jgi:hypothetical protein